MVIFFARPELFSQRVYHTFTHADEANGDLFPSILWKWVWIMISMKSDSYSHFLITQYCFVQAVRTSLLHPEQLPTTTVFYLGVRWSEDGEGIKNNFLKYVFVLSTTRECDLVGLERSLKLYSSNKGHFYTIPQLWITEKIFFWNVR